MKGIVLAGGMGTRLAPLTQDDNKHLLPCWKKRMVEIPISTLVSAGIQDIVLITGGKRPGAFLELLRNGSDYGASRLFYTYQVGSGGIADALKLAEPFLEEDEPCVVILGDNYFESGIKDQVEDWRNQGCNGASVILTETETPWEFGIAEVKDDKIISVEEKPKSPKSKLAILGGYMLDYRVWEFINNIKPSKRGELEITDVLRLYMDASLLSFSMYDGFWSDMGSFENWILVSQRLARMDGCKI